MEEKEKEKAMEEIMAKFNLTWNNIIALKKLDEEKALKLKESVLDVLNSISLHDYLSLLPASVLAVLGEYTVEKFTKHYILTLLTNIFDYRLQKGQIFLINHHEFNFNYNLDNHVLTVYFNAMARERLPGMMGDELQIQTNPYDLYYTKHSRQVLTGDYAWGGVLHLPVTMLNFNENEIKMWKLSGKQLEFEELELKDMIFETTHTVTFKDIPEYVEKNRGFLGVSDSW